MKNSLNRNIPEFINGIGKIAPFTGAWNKLKKGWMDEITISPPNKAKLPHQKKLTETLKEAIIKTSPKDGMTVSFHHHLRNGDFILVEAIKILAELGIKNITLASSSLNDSHTELIKYIKDGTITKIWTSGIRGKLGKAISEGIMKNPVIIHSHGGRVRAIHTGKIAIDLCIIAASAADEEGNANGAIGKSAFGSLGYARIDSRYSKQVIIVTDNLVEFPCFPLSVQQNFVDYVVKVASIGDPTKIASGTTRITKSPMDLRIAKLAADVIEKSGYFKNGFSFQVGAGGASLAVAKFIRKKMENKEIKGSFLLGGVTSYGVDMLNEGLFKTIFDVQSFDAEVSSSLYNNKNHIEISASLYANPYNCGCMTNKLDIVVLGALEVDVDFNVNVITGSKGYLRGASGGHCDTASGAELTVVVCPSFRGRISTVNKRVDTIVTPGESVDVVVTERGICVNPNKPALEQILMKAGLNIRNIEDLQKEVEKIVGIPNPIERTDKIVALIEYRDGTAIDVVRQLKTVE
ncbi:MAG: citrate lyase subunit alpha [Lutibacter sp.]|uniref:citrate lyase subunit alpha n=1 Tax=Lutibacter sp. TaxID=1925666 RepID=UPI00385E14D2